MDSTDPNSDSTVKKAEQGDKDQQQQEQSTGVSFVNNEGRITPSAVLQYVLDNDQPYDTIISCADGKIGAHRLVLASASPFIGAMFCSFNHRLGEVATLVLPDMRVEIMKPLLNLCYTGRLIFSKEDESEILDAMRYLMIGEFGNLTMKKVTVAKPVARCSRSATSNTEARLLDREISPERPIPPCDSSSDEEEGDNDNELQESSDDGLFEKIVIKITKEKSEKLKTDVVAGPSCASDNQLNQSLQSNQEEATNLEAKGSPPLPGKDKQKIPKRGTSNQKPIQMPTVLTRHGPASKKRRLAKEAKANAKEDTLLSPGSPSGNNPSKRLRRDCDEELPETVKTKRLELLGPLREGVPSLKSKPGRKGIKQLHLDLSNLPKNVVQIRYPSLFVSECLKTERGESNIPHPTANATPENNNKPNTRSAAKAKAQNLSQESFQPSSVGNGNSDLNPDPGAADCSII